MDDALKKLRSVRNAATRPFAARLRPLTRRGSGRPYTSPMPMDPHATYYRLTDATWAQVVEEYANGARAKPLAAKWNVAASSIYRHAAAAGLTKRDAGDKRARAHAKAVMLAQKAREAKAGPKEDTPDPTLRALFAPELESEEADPAALAKQATLASGRAMRGRLWAEAKALAGLAESYRRLAAAEAAARNAAAQAEAQSWWPKSMEEEEAMRDELYRKLVLRAQAIDEEEALEAAQGMADAMGVEGPDMEEVWRWIEASDAELATGGDEEAKSAP